MADEPETVPEDSGLTTDRIVRVAPRLGLSICWYEGGASRIGEVCLLGDSTVVLGRGGPTRADGAPRAAFGRERPGRFGPREPLASPHISRVQLRVCLREDFTVEIENVGKLPLSHNGVRVGRTTAREGDTLALGAQLLLVVVRRTVTSEAGPVPAFPFGDADENGIVGESRAAWALREAVAFAAAHEGHVLIHGASGTGKELVARAVHAMGRRADGPFVSRNAATFPESLIDAELFGNARNYPNVGAPERPGLVGEADGGTLFLDEFAELPHAMQAHLLRVLDAGEYQRLGESRTRRASFRFVGATNRPLTALKEDVLARLVHRIGVPGLAARIEDVPLIARHVLRRLAVRTPPLAKWLDPSGEPRFSFDLVVGMLARSYPTNVRELEALLLRAAASSPAERLELAPEDQVVTGVRRQPVADRPASDDLEGGDLSPSAIQACLDRHNGVLEATWRSLGLSSRHALARLVKKHKLEVRRKPAP